MVTFQLLLGSTSTDIFKDKGGFESLKKNWDVRFKLDGIFGKFLVLPQMVC